MVPRDMGSQRRVISNGKTVLPATVNSQNVQHRKALADGGTSLDSPTAPAAPGAHHTRDRRSGLSFRRGLGLPSLPTDQ